MSPRSGRPAFSLRTTKQQVNAVTAEIQAILAAVGAMYEVLQVRFAAAPV